jgi:predicted nucleic acid-binding Zn ribbon protein
MRKPNDKSIKEAMDQLFQVYKLQQKFDETALIAAWPEMMGVAIANRTKELYIRQKKLFVRVESSVIKNELRMMRSQIIEKMNEQAGGEVIVEIVLL